MARAIGWLVFFALPWLMPESDANLAVFWLASLGGAGTAAVTSGAAAALTGGAAAAGAAGGAVAGGAAAMGAASTAAPAGAALTQAAGSAGLGQGAAHAAGTSAPVGMFGGADAMQSGLPAPPPPPVATPLPQAPPPQGGGILDGIRSMGRGIGDFAGDVFEHSDLGQAKKAYDMGGWKGLAEKGFEGSPMGKNLGSYQRMYDSWKNPEAGQEGGFAGFRKQAWEEMETNPGMFQGEDPREQQQRLMQHTSNARADWQRQLMELRQMQQPMRRGY